MKVGYLALIVVFLMGFFILIFPPFVASAYVPGFIRIPILFLVVLFFFWLVSDRRKFIIRFAPFLLYVLFQEVYWFFTGNPITGESLYFLLFIILALSVLVGADRIKGLKFLVEKFYLLLIILFSALSILSFLAFNLDLVSYTLKPVGEEAYYTNFHNPLLGYISVKRLETGMIGRVCGFFFEPSYLGWFLTVNFFLLKKLIKTKNTRIYVSILVFLGAIATYSTAAWIVFAIVFLLQFVYIVLNLLSIRGKTANTMVVLGAILAIVLFIAVVPKDKLLQNLATSSADNREERISSSLFVLANSSPIDLLFGRSPGYIEANAEMGESNQLVKLIVETGIISTLLILYFVIYCTRKSRYFMVANLLFLNSVVILFTPLYILNLLICYWIDEPQHEP